MCTYVCVCVCVCAVEGACSELRQHAMELWSYAHHTWVVSTVCHGAGCLKLRYPRMITCWTRAQTTRNTSETLQYVQLVRCFPVAPVLQPCCCCLLYPSSLVLVSVRLGFSLLFSSSGELFLAGACLVAVYMLMAGLSDRQPRCMQVLGL